MPELTVKGFKEPMECLWNNKSLIAALKNLKRKT